VALLLGWTATSVATADPAERAQTVVAGLLESFKPTDPASGEFVYDQDYTLSQENGVYTALVTEAAWIEDDTRIDFGPLTIAVEPQASAASKIDFSLGDVIRIREEDKLLGEITLGKQDHAGAWDEKRQEFTDLRAHFQQLVLTLPAELVRVTVADAVIDHTLQNPADDRWQRRQSLELTELQAKAAPGAWQLAKFEVQLNLVADAYETFRLIDELAGLMQNGEPPPLSQTPLLAVATALDQSVQRIDYSLALEDFAISEAEQTVFALQQAGMGVYFDDNADDGATLRKQLELNGLQFQAHGIPADMIPSTARFEIGLSDIPPDFFSRLTQIGLASEQLPLAERDAYVNVELMKLLSGSKLALFVKDSFIEAPDARLRLNLRAVSKPASKVGGSGEFNLLVENLDKILAVTGAAGADAQEGIATFLAMILVFADRTEQDDKTIDRFSVQFKEDGTLWLNGKDISAMFNQSAPAP